MKIQKLAATLLNVRRLIAFAGLLTLMAGPALAVKPGTPPPDCTAVVSSWCETELLALCEATEAARSLKPRDRDGLISKVVGAGIKLTQGKTDDADQKLDNYESKLDQLVNAPKPKISEDDADALSAALIAAQTCVAALP